MYKNKTKKDYIYILTMRRQMHRSEPFFFGGAAASDINTVYWTRGKVWISRTDSYCAFFVKCWRSPPTLRRTAAAWERKCCLSGGSGVPGSVLAAETCPLDEPATAALSTFGWNAFSTASSWRLNREESSSYWESFWAFSFFSFFVLSEDNNGVKQEISVLKRDVRKAPSSVAPGVNEKLKKSFPH